MGGVGEGCWGVSVSFDDFLSFLLCCAAGGDFGRG